MANEDVKNLIKKRRLFQYEVAEVMGISEGYLATILRKPLSEEQKQKVLEAITKLSEEQSGDMSRWFLKRFRYVFYKKGQL